MKEEWIFEKGASDYCIFVGSVSFETIHELAKQFSKLLWIVHSKDNCYFDNISEKSQKNFNSEENFRNLLKNLPENISVLDIYDFEFNKILQRFIISSSKNIPVIKISKTILSESQKYQSIFTNLVEIIDSNQRQRNSRRLTGFVVQKNLFENLFWRLSCPFNEKFQEISNRSFIAVVTGAGQSLDITLPIVAKWNLPIIWFASDRSAKALLKCGISPDFVISIDPQKSFEYCDLNNFKLNSQSNLILSSDSHASWFCNDYQKFIVCKGEKTDLWFDKNGIPITPVLANSNSGLTSLIVAKYCNPSVIILLGMDLSTERKSEFDRYSKFMDNPSLGDTQNSFSEIPGNFSESVLTPFISDWKDTCEFCQTIKKTISVINFTDRGALINNTRVVSPENSDVLLSILQGTFLTEEQKDDKQFANPAKLPSELRKNFTSNDKFSNKKNLLPEKFTFPKELIAKLNKIFEKISVLRNLTLEYDTNFTEKYENNFENQEILAIELSNTLKNLAIDEDISECFGSFVFNLMYSLVHESPKLENLLSFSKEFCILTSVLNDSLSKFHS